MLEEDVLELQVSVLRNVGDTGTLSLMRHYEGWRGTNYSRAQWIFASELKESNTHPSSSARLPNILSGKQYEITVPRLECLPFLANRPRHARGKVSLSLPQENAPQRISRTSKRSRFHLPPRVPFAKESPNESTCRTRLWKPSRDPSGAIFPRGVLRKGGSALLRSDSLPSYSSGFGELEPPSQAQQGTKTSRRRYEI